MTRRRERDFKPTHRIVFPAGEIAVMLLGDEAWTATAWDRGGAADLTVVQGTWLWHGLPTSGDWKIENWRTT